MTKTCKCMLHQYTQPLSLVGTVIFKSKIIPLQWEAMHITTYRKCAAPQLGWNTYNT